MEHSATMNIGGALSAMFKAISGEGKANPEYKAILEVDKRLTAAGIPHTLERMMDGWIILYHCNGKRKADVIEHCGSYGNRFDLMEIWGFGLKDPIGNLNADEVFRHFDEWHRAAIGKPSTAK